MNSKTNTDKNIRRINFLDYVRILAFLSVLVGHKLFAQHSSLLGADNHATLRFFAGLTIPLTWGGLAGVILFFLTSGYIITHVLQRERTSEFLIRRMFRIYPLFVAAVLLELLLNWGINNVPFPPVSRLLPTLFLIGDFTGTGYSLGGVEWTLRIEIIFYVFMALMRALGVILLPRLVVLVFLICTTLLYFANPFPRLGLWTDGYLNLYIPFLFLGSILYLYEQKMIQGWLFFVALAFIFFLHLKLVPKISPSWKESHAVFYALVIFLLFWCGRERFSKLPIVTFFSELTYSIYLFHNWIWGYLEKIVQSFGVNFISLNIQVLILLTIVCYVSYRVIEKPGIRVGRSISKHMNAYSGSVFRSKQTV